MSESVKLPLTVGQRLRHHTAGVWTVREKRGGPYDDYLIRCTDDPGRSWRPSEQGREIVVHGEYVERSFYAT